MKCEKRKKKGCNKEQAVKKTKINADADSSVLPSPDGAAATLSLHGRGKMFEGKNLRWRGKCLSIVGEKERGERLRHSRRYKLKQLVLYVFYNGIGFRLIRKY